MSFDLDGYVDVAERISEFKTKYPNGVLQSELTLQDNPSGWLCKAYAYRDTDDPLPGVGHAFEPVPGKTPYTRDSEAMNAETSAWGRAIVALGFETKKIASANEIRNRQDGGAQEGRKPVATDVKGDGHGGGAASAHPANDGEWRWPFGKHKGLSLAETPLDYVQWYADNGTKADVQQLCATFLGRDGTGDSDIPF